MTPDKPTGPKALTSTFLSADQCDGIRVWLDTPHGQLSPQYLTIRDLLATLYAARVQLAEAEAQARMFADARMGDLSGLQQGLAEAREKLEASGRQHSLDRASIISSLNGEIDEARQDMQAAREECEYREQERDAAIQRAEEAEAALVDARDSARTAQAEVAGWRNRAITAEEARQVIAERTLEQAVAALTPTTPDPNLPARVRSLVGPQHASDEELCERVRRMLEAADVTWERMRGERDEAQTKAVDLREDFHERTLEAKRYREALHTIRQWDALNPPDRKRVADSQWLADLIDAALAGGDGGTHG